MANPSATLYAALTGEGGPTVSGEHVNENTALTLSGYFAAIRAISEDAAKLPLILYQRTKGGKRRAYEHPLYKILHDNPSSECSSMSFRETILSHAIGWGNGYAEIVRMEKSFEVAALHLIDPTTVQVGRAPDGALAYVVRPNGGQRRVLPADRVFHIHGLGFDGVTGYSAVTLAREAIGAGLAQEKSGAALFGNSARPDGILSVPAALKDGGKKLAEAWKSAYRGSSSAHGLAVLDEGATFQSIAVPNKDCQWIEARQFTVIEMCRFLRIPPHKVFDLLRATFSNIEHQSLSYVTDTLMPWHVRIEQEIQRKLISPLQPQYFAEHLVDALLRGDTTTRYAAYAVGRTHGWLSANDVRRMENRNGIGPAGDIYMVQATMVSAESLLLPPEPAAKPVAPDLKLVASAHRELLESAYARVLKVEADKVECHAKRDNYADWLAIFYRRHTAFVAEAIYPVVDAICHTLWALGGDGGPYQQRRAQVLSLEMAERYVAESQAGDLTDDYTRTRAITDWTNGRAAKTADAELPHILEVIENGTETVSTCGTT